MLAAYIAVYDHSEASTCLVSKDQSTHDLIQYKSITNLLLWNSVCLTTNQLPKFKTFHCLYLISHASVSKSSIQQSLDNATANICISSSLSLTTRIYLFPFLLFGKGPIMFVVITCMEYPDLTFWKAPLLLFCRGNNRRVWGECMHDL